MKKLLTLCLLFISMVLSTEALASGQGLYIGGELGYNNVDADSFVAFDGMDFYLIDGDFSHVGAGLNVGYNFAIDPQFLIGGELSMDYIAQTSHTNIDLYSVALQATATYMFTPKFEVFAKGGIVREELDDSYAYSSSDLAPIASVGAGYNINKNWEVYTQYSHIFGKSLEDLYKNGSNSALTVDSALFGVRFTIC